MRFCSQCGAERIEFKVPTGDNRERHVCVVCETVFYDNPRIVAGTVPVWEDQVLLLPGPGSGRIPGSSPTAWRNPGAAFS